MKSVFQAALLSGAVAVGIFAMLPPAAAQLGISINLGDVAVGYQDGYWDHHHHWHAWRNHNDWTQYRQAHPENYHDWRHDDPHHR
jgi:hypothetical protein